MDERQNGSDTGIAQIDGASQKAGHQDRAEDAGGRDGVKDGAGEYDWTHDTGQVHREPGFLVHARDLCRREKLDSAVCHQSDNDKRAHHPAGPQGTMQGHDFGRLMQGHSFGHLSFSLWGIPYSEPTVSLYYE